jgi:hypothetical protein
VIDEIHACARQLLRSPAPAAALLGGEQRRPWNVARNDGSGGAAQPCACRIYRESIGDLCSSLEFQVSVPLTVCWRGDTVF